MTMYRHHADTQTVRKEQRERRFAALLDMTVAVTIGSALAVLIVSQLCK